MLKVEGCIWSGGNWCFARSLRCRCSRVNSDITFSLGLFMEAEQSLCETKQQLACCSYTWKCMERFGNPHSLSNVQNMK